MTSTHDIETRLLDFIKERFLYDRPGVQVALDQPLISEGIVDSVGILQLVGFIERTYEISVRPEDLVLKNFQTVSALGELVRSYLERDD